MIQVCGWACPRHSAHTEVRGRPITWVNPWVSKPSDTQPNGRREPTEGRSSHPVAVLLDVVTPRWWEAAASGRPFPNHSSVLLRAHTAHSQARPILQPGIFHAAGFCWALCPAWRLWPCYCILFTTAIALTVHMNLEGSSRQVIAAAVSDLRHFCGICMAQIRKAAQRAWSRVL